MSLSPSTALQLDDRVRFGFITGSTSPAGARRNVELAESAGYDSLWTGEEVSHSGKHFSFDSVCMRPATTRPGGPPIWCGARSEPALRRTGRLAGGYVSYAVTPAMFADALRVIEQAAESAGRLTAGLPFGTGHLLFAWIEDDPEVALDKATDHLSRRYAMDFRKAARKYAALGRPEDVAERVQAYLDQGVRHIIVDATGPGAERESQLERFGKEVIPLLRSAAA